MLQMKLCGDLVLREKCAPITEITPDVLDILDEMVGMMRDQNGVGLAAPQVGYLKRFLVMMNPDDETVFKMINPKIITRSAEQCTMEEGCLSVLGHDNLPVYANVTRPASVEVEWMNEHGEQLRAQNGPSHRPLGELLQPGSLWPAGEQRGLVLVPPVRTHRRGALFQRGALLQSLSPGHVLL